MIPTLEKLERLQPNTVVGVRAHELADLVRRAAEADRLEREQRTPRLAS